MEKVRKIYPMNKRKKKQDLKPDTVLKNYWSNNEQFADLFNAVLFDGKPVIHPNELEDSDTEESSILEHKEMAETLKASRDTIKIRKKLTTVGVELVLLGLESQERIHYAMPMRLMGYDYGSYKKQYEQNASKYNSRDDLTEDEFLSKMKKTDKFIPVVTVVVYYGENPWDGAKCLHEMLNIPEEWKPFVNDYKMLLVEAKDNNLKLHNINNQDLFNLLEILLDTSLPTNTAKERAMQYGREHQTQKEVVMTVAGAANCTLDYNAFARKGDGDMCSVFEATRLAGVEQGIEQGIAQGIEQGIEQGNAKGIIEMGIEYGLSEQDILERLQKKLNISLSKAQEYFEKFHN